MVDNVWQRLHEGNSHMISNVWLFSVDFTVCSNYFDPDLDPLYCVEKDKDFEQLTANVRCDCGNYTMFRTTTTTGLPTAKDPWTTAPVSTTAGKP